MQKDWRESLQSNQSVDPCRRRGNKEAALFLCCRVELKLKLTQAKWPACPHFVRTHSETSLFTGCVCVCVCVCVGVWMLVWEIQFSEASSFFLLLLFMSCFIKACQFVLLLLLLLPPRPAHCSLSSSSSDNKSRAVWRGVLSGEACSH